MTRFIAGIVVLVATIIIGLVAGGYLGYFVGMVYSLTNGWMFAVKPTTIAGVFAVLGSLFVTIVLISAWSIAYADVKREEKFEQAMKSLKERGKQ